MSFRRTVYTDGNSHAHSHSHSHETTEKYVSPYRHSPWWAGPLYRSPSMHSIVRCSSPVRQTKVFYPKCSNNLSPAKRENIIDIKIETTTPVRRTYSPLRVHSPVRMHSPVRIVTPGRRKSFCIDKSSDFVDHQNKCGHKFDYKYEESESIEKKGLCMFPHSRSLTNLSEMCSKLDNSNENLSNRITVVYENLPQNEKHRVKFADECAKPSPVTKSTEHKYDYKFEETEIIEKRGPCVFPHSKSLSNFSNNSFSKLDKCDGRPSNLISYMYENIPQVEKHTVNFVEHSAKPSISLPINKSTEHKYDYKYEETEIIEKRDVFPQTKSIYGSSKKLDEKTSNKVTHVFDNTSNDNNHTVTYISHTNEDTSLPGCLVKASPSHLPVNRSLHCGAIFNGNSFGLLTEQMSINGSFNVSFKFRTSQKDGILMMIVDSRSKDSFFIELYDSQIKSTLFLNGEPDSCWTDYSSPVLSNYVWIDVNVQILNNKMTMHVKNNLYLKHHRSNFQSPIRGDLFVAGHPSTITPPFVCHSKDFFVGEMKDFYVNSDGIKWYGIPSCISPRLRNWH